MSNGLYWPFWPVSALEMSFWPPHLILATLKHLSFWAFPKSVHKCRGGVGGGGGDVVEGGLKKDQTFYIFLHPISTPSISILATFKAVRDYHSFQKCNFNGVSPNDYRLHGEGRGGGELHNIWTTPNRDHIIRNRQTKQKYRLHFVFRNTRESIIPTMEVINFAVASFFTNSKNINWYWLGHRCQLKGEVNPF